MWPQWLGVWRGGWFMTDIVNELRATVTYQYMPMVVRQHLDDAASEIERLRAIINEPVTADFVMGANLEAAHQRERWGSQHDAGKEPADWFWLIGYLAQKAMTAHMAENRVKAAHHAISTAAALANWHLAIIGTDTSMRPGIELPSC